MSLLEADQSEGNNMTPDERIGEALAKLLRARGYTVKRETPLGAPNNTYVISLGGRRMYHFTPTRGVVEACWPIPVRCVSTSRPDLVDLIVRTAEYHMKYGGEDNCKDCPCYKPPFYGKKR
jgi:hypothetical protein